MEEPRTAGLDAVRARRAELGETLHALERALARPTGDPEGGWATPVHAALDDLARDFEAHITVTEGPGGLHQAILEGDVRLANAVETLTGEHRTIAAEIAELRAETDPAAKPVADPTAIRERATRTLGQLIRHRQRGADLIYEAFSTDIGGDG